MGGKKSEYSVGYGKPPKNTRFRKGESGNPKGRPRKPGKQPSPTTTGNSIDDIFRRELDRTYRITDNDGPREIAASEAIIRSQIRSAIKGNSLAQRDTIRVAQELEAREAYRARQEKEREREIFDGVVRWKQRRVQAWRVAEQNDEEPDNPWPHPEDILIDYEDQKWGVRGPSRMSDVPHYKYIAALRDLYLLQSELAARARTKSGRGWVEFHTTMWIAFDVRLPLRWQISGSDDRLLLSIAMTDIRRLRRSIQECEREVRYWHRIIYPLGEEVRLTPEIAAVLRPHLKRFGYKSIRQLEHKLEVESGNPPLSG